MIVKTDCETDGALHSTSGHGSQDQWRCLTISSLGTVRPQPWEHGTGFLGLCSHSLRWWESVSSLTTTEQPYSSLSHLHHTRVTCHVSLDTCQDSHRISRRLSRFLRILGTGFSSAMEMLRLSTGQVCCLLSHCTMQSAQNACSHLRKYNLKLIKYFCMAVLMCKIVFIKSTNLTSGPTHSGARRGSSSTALQMGQMSSSSTEPSNLVTS